MNVYLFMKKIFIAILLFCAIIFCNAQSESEYQTFVEKCLKPTVLIGSNDDSITGTGVIVKSEKLKYVDAYFNVIFSCDHILKSNKQNIKISEFDKNGIFVKYTNAKAVVFYKDRDDDLSILFFTSDNIMPTADLSFNYNPKLKDFVFSIGHGMGDHSRYTDGVITGALKTKEDFTDYKTSIPIIFGDSGGPLFYKNKLIGITNSIRSLKVTENVKVPVYNISTFKSLNLFNKILNTTSLSDKDFKNLNIPEILGVDLWLKYQKNILDN